MQDDPPECARIAAELDRLNRERQAIELATVAQAEAEAMAALGVREKGAVVVTAAEGWHPAWSAWWRRGSRSGSPGPPLRSRSSPAASAPARGRSIAGVDLGRAVRQAVSEGLLIKGGGHAMAAGVTLRKDALALSARISKTRSPRGRGGASRGCAADRRRRSPLPPRPSTLVAAIARAGHSARAIPSR